MAKQIINIGDTGAQLISKLATNFNDLYTGDLYYNAVSYGAVGDNSTDNTEAIQDLLDSLSATGGTIYFPSGVYKTHTLTVPNNVCLLGDKGKNTSVLRSISAEPLINVVHTTFKAYNSLIQNITLNGNSIGTIGLNTQWVGCFRMADCIVNGFTDTQIKLIGTLVGEFDNCYIQGGQYGVYADKYNGASIAPNALTFTNCEFYSSSKYAAKFNNGASVRFRDCDLEGNGTNGDGTTGVIYHTNYENLLDHTIVGLILDGCWIEANYGGMILIDDNVATTKTNLSIISNTIMISNTPEFDLKVVGATSPNKVILRGNTLSDSIANSVIIDGAGAEVRNDLSYIYGSVIKTNSGKYYTVDYTEITE